MAHFGVFCPPVPGHIHPMCALGRTLLRRGHDVTVFNVEELAPAVRAQGLPFVPLCDRDFPPGALHSFKASLAELGGIDSLRFAIQGACRIARLILDRAPEAVRGAGIDVLLVDQNEPAGGSVAEHLGLPFLSICTSLPLNSEPAIPPPFVGWGHSDRILPVLRNRVARAVSNRLIRSIQQTLNGYRTRWNLVPLRSPDDSFSRLAQIAQMPVEFDFPRKCLSPVFHYSGPWFDDLSPRVDFPFELLNGKPLIYGSLGTLQPADSHYFQFMVEACSDLDAQLVLSLGSNGAMTRPDTPESTIVVAYAPQLQLLARAAVAITHSGMNTTQQSLHFGVPLVAVPLTHDQPAIAARLARTGAGIVLPKERVTAGTMRAAVRSLLEPDSAWRKNAQRMKDACRAGGGVERAAEIAESVFFAHRRQGQKSFTAGFHS